MKFFILFIIIVSLKVQAKPLSMEVWFLSPDASVSATTVPVLGDRVASDYSCIPMGDGCFHPQLGMVKKLDDDKEDTKPNKDVKKKIDIDLIDCGREGQFNFFCNSKIKESKKSLEIWLDISTSMRKLTLNNKECIQGQFLSSIESDCRASTTFSFFNTKLYNDKSPSGACELIGLNNNDTLIRDIQDSDAGYLIVITDIDEYNGALRTYIDKNHIATRGLESKMTLASLKNNKSRILKYCK